MKPSQDSPKGTPRSPEPADEPSGGAAPPGERDGELMPRPDHFPEDRPKTEPPPVHDQRRNRSV